MKHRRFVIASALVMIGVACAIAVLALYSSHLVRASAPSLPDALNNIPSDYQFISGINVQRFVTSPYYATLRQKQNQPQQIANDLATFIEQTGVDPTRDVSYLVFAGGSNGQGVGIVTGTFDPDKIISFIKSKASPTEIEYAKVRVITVPDKNNSSVQNGIAFLSNREIAVGNLESIKSVLDTRAGTRKNILSNTGVSSLISNINPEEMFWFAGDASGLLARAPLSTPLGQNLSSIQSIVGTLNITDAVVGKITAVTVSSEAAAKLTDVFKGLVSLGQLSGNQNPDLKTLLDGLTVSQKDSAVTLSLNIPVALLEKLPSNGPKVSSGIMRMNPARPQTAGPAGSNSTNTAGDAVKPPTAISQPLPPYTPEAREAKIQGVVLISATIRKDGTVADAVVTKGLGYGLDESALQTIMTQWRFQPGTVKGVPVDVKTNIAVSFRPY